jgi:hypothetical protein
MALIKEKASLADALAHLDNSRPTSAGKAGYKREEIVG